MQNLTQNNRLLIFANDPAGANVTMAYAKLNKDKYNYILAYHTNISKYIYQEHIPEYIDDIKNLSFKQNDTVITGSSGIDSSFELNIIKKANQFNVKKTVMIVDSTSNFLMRFKINDKLIEEKYSANEIWIFEKYFKSSINFIDKRIKEKINYYDKYIYNLYKINPPKINNKFIQKYKNKYLLIVTEYIYDLYKLKFGFTEYDMLEHILSSIKKEKLYLLPILLKLHPKEHKHKFNILLRKYSMLNIQQIDCNIQEIIYYSNKILGINSSIFKEAKLLNKPIYSIQINSKNIIYSNNVPQENIIFTKKELINIL
jgi:hypothetical protein